MRDDEHPPVTVIERAMRRALELAALGPADNENPQVGCVIVAPNGDFVAEGWHRGAGTAHAEVDALANLPEVWRDRAIELTAVVTLEPCNHQGKTGPCAVALGEARIGSVVYSLPDPGNASGGGAVRLAQAGVRLRSGVLAADTKRLLTGWLQRYAAEHPVSRPRITVKWAQSLDGRIAAADGSSQWITGEVARLDVHQRRAAADAIMVGTGTLLADNPSLTARAADGSLLAAQPKPVVVGTRPIPANARVREHPALGTNEAPLQFDGTDLAADMASLCAAGIRTVFVEGGPTLISALFRAGLVDDLLVYTAPMLLGGPYSALNEIGVSTLTEARELDITEITHLKADTLVVARVSAEHG